MRTTILSFLLFFSLTNAQECGKTHIENQYGFIAKACSADKKSDMLKQLKKALENIFKEKNYGKKQ